MYGQPHNQLESLQDRLHQLLAQPSVLPRPVDSEARAHLAPKGHHEHGQGGSGVAIPHRVQRRWRRPRDFADELLARGARDDSLERLNEKQY